MENSTILDTGTAEFAGNKLKGEIMENRCSMDNESRKGLSDISNLQQQHKVLNQGAKLLLQPDSMGTKEFIHKLQQENMMLMKVLADRNKVIKLSGIELQKLRINLEKFQQQNLLLAQANSQMLAELNLSKDRLKALKHELGCKDAVLKAIKLELGTNKCGMEVESHKEEDREGKLCNINRCSEADESHEEDQGEDKPCNTNRKRQSYCLGTSNIKPVQVEVGVENKRVCSRRHSARRKAQEPQTTESVFEVDDQKFLASSASDDKMLESGPSNIEPVQAKEGINNKSKVCSRRQSARRKAQEPETTEDVFEVDDPKFLASSTSDDKVLESGPSNIEPVQAKEGIDNKSKACSRRQSARRKAQEPETTEDVFEVDDPKFLASSTSDDKMLESGPSNIEPVQAKEGIHNKSKVCSRRQSSRPKTQETETTEDVFEVDDRKFLTSSTSNGKVLESGPSNIEPVQAKEGIDNKSKACSRRQSARRKAQEPETTEDVFEVDDPKFLASSTSDDKMLESGPSNIEPVQAKEGIHNKSKVCSRRQSSRPKTQETETTEDVFEVDDRKFLTSSTSNGKVLESGPSNIEPVQAKEGIDNKSKACSRRQSARRKAQEPETTEDVFEVDDPKFLASSTSDDKMLESGPSNIEPVQAKEGIHNKSKVCSRRQSSRPKTQETETTEDVFEVDDRKFLTSSTSNGKVLESAPSNIEPSQAKEGINIKSKVCSRRQSVTRKAREPEATEDIFEVDDKVYESGPSDIKSVQAKAGIDNKRTCLRRQSGRFKPQEPETSKDVFEVGDARILFSSTGDDKVHESGQLSFSDSSVKSEHDNRRVSAGRPLRRAVEKVQSYKEMKLNVKMRRKE